MSRFRTETRVGRIIVFAVILIALVAASFFLAPRANAQTVDVGSHSSSEANSSAGSQSNNANQVNINSTSPEQQTYRYDGSYTVKGNTPVGLAAAVSFSSDYCGGTNSAGASGAGITIGGSRVSFDPNCQALRRVEKMGMLAVSLHNMGSVDMARRMQALAVWQMCLVTGEQDKTLLDACRELTLIEDRDMPRVMEPTPQQQIGMQYKPPGIR